MKKIYSIIGLLAISASAWAQSSYIIKKDFTSTLTNAALSGTVETVDIATYDYNMPDDGVGADPANVGKFGMQTIPGWTASNPSNNIKVLQSANDKDNVRDDEANARACGIYNFIEEGASEAVPSIGGTTLTGIPVVFVNGTESHPGPALGMLGVWGATVQYTQEVTLPAGAYAISANVCNAYGSTDMAKNLLGFIAEDGTEYLSTNKTFPPEQYTWTEDVAMFILDKETKGVISIGYTAAHAGSGASPHLFYEPIHLYEIDPAPLIQAQIDAAKENLLKVIQDGEQVGADTKAAQDIYNSASATLQQVLDAIESQKKLNEAAIVDLSEYFISNPHFTEDVAIGINEETGLPEGITTYDYDRTKNNVSYYSMQPVKGWVANHPAKSLEDNPLDVNNDNDKTGNNGSACGVVAIGSGAWIGGTAYVVPNVMSNGSKEGQVLGFLTCWNRTTQYTQNVTIPAGKYTLTISYYNTGGNQDVAKNLMGFIADNGTEYLSETKNFKIGSWEKMTVAFVLDEPTAGHFSVGYQATNTGSGNMPHFFIDGIALNYVGDATFDPSLFALQAAVGSAKELLKENFYEDLKTEFEEKVEAGDELCKAFSSDKEANKKAMDDINAMLTDVNANIKAYADLKKFYYEDLQEAFAKYEDKAGHDLILDAINDINDEIPNVLSDYTWDTQKINETIASLPVIIKEKTQVLYDAAKAGEYEGDPIDITSLFEGLGYTYSTSAVKNTAIPDKQWIYGNASEFKTQYATAEVWNQSPFEVYQTLSNMPAGTYTVKTKAFYRTADNATNYTNYQEDQTPKAFVMGGFSKAPIINVAELAKESETEGWVAIANGSTTYVPNNQLAASNIFNDVDLAEKVQVSVQTVLAAEGDLKIGVTADQMEGDSWVIWYGFELEYDPNVDDKLLAEEIKAAKATITEYMDPMVNEDAAYITAPATNAATAALAGNDMQTLVQTIQALKDNVKASKDVDAAFEELQTTASEYLDCASAEAVAKFSEVAAKYSSKTDLNTEELAAFTEEIKAADKALRIPDGTGASDDNPIDFTSVITNADFEANAKEQQATGWTLVKGEGASGNYQVQTGFEGVSMEFWSNTNGSGTKYDFYQRISGLPAGTYVLTADAANSLNGQPVGPGEGAAYIYAAAASGETLRYASSDPIAVQEASCNGDDKTWNNYQVVIKIAESDDLIVGSRSVGDLAARWVMIDNFMLAYHGTDSALDESGDPSAIESIATVSSEKATAIYSISGAKVSSLQKGINIVKMADGKVKKILVK